ncbi:hypothetical protein OKW41_005163 [Paraburkholderia sp. UCT70]
MEKNDAAGLLPMHGVQPRSEKTLATWICWSKKSFDTDSGFCKVHRTQRSQHEHKQCQQNNRRNVNCGHREWRGLCERATRYERDGRRGRTKGGGLGLAASTQAGYFDSS